MNFLEKDLEQIIYETNNYEIVERGLFIKGKKFKQVYLGGYGRLDLVTLERGDNKIFITVYEFKKDEVGVNTYLQALTYCKGISRYINKRGLFKNIKVVYRIILVGSSIEKSAFCYMPDFIENLRVYTYKYLFDGIYFNKECGYHLIKDGF